MHKINTPDSLFHDGNPATGALGTIVNAAWLNALQSELATVIEAAGIKLEADKSDQLKLAIGKMISTAGMLPAASRVVGSAAELNALRANGFYTVLNANADGHVLHIQHAGSTNYAAQIMFGQWGQIPTTAGTGFSWRALINGVWSEWQRFFHSGNLDLASLATTTGSLQLRPTLGDKVDLNSITASGLYHQRLNVYAASGSNYPLPQAGMLSVYACDNMVYQHYLDYQGRRLWWRVKYNDTWSAWQASATLDDIATTVPAGHVSFFARNSAPPGYLKANGAALSRSAYANLFAAIGTTFGAGDGASTFNLPDLRGEFVRGFDDGRGVDVNRIFGNSQPDSFQGHWHTFTRKSDIPGPPAAGEDSYGRSPDGGGGITTADKQSILTDGMNGTPRVSTETRPRNIALLACIKF